MAVVCMLMGEVCPEARACWLVGGPGLQAAGLVLSCSWCLPTGGWSWVPGSLAAVAEALRAHAGVICLQHPSLPPHSVRWEIQTSSCVDRGKTNLPFKL